MNSLELAFHMKYLNMDTRASMPPPETLSMSHPTATSQDYELDCSQFDLMSVSYSSYGSQYSQQNNQRRYQQQQQSTNSNGSGGMIKGWGSSLSRSRCVSNLSCLGSTASSSEGSVRLSSQPRTYESSPNAGGSWGYYVDSVSD